MKSRIGDGSVSEDSAHLLLAESTLVEILGLLSAFDLKYFEEAKQLVERKLESLQNLFTPLESILQAYANALTENNRTHKEEISKFKERVEKLDDRCFSMPTERLLIVSQL